MSIPRDSYVPIPGRGSSNKINAAFAFGGAWLLTETVQQATGLHIDGYLEIGFEAARVVDSLGGVDKYAARDMKDELAGIDLKAGMSGPGRQERPRWRAIASQRPPGRSGPSRTSAPVPRR